ncbi:hypothetical protein A8D81_28365 [Burkholderia cenocepacia]|nr:hypothetical protein A8D81_28365 [Burkholderia cenocepacia]
MESESQPASHTEFRIPPIDEATRQANDVAIQQDNLMISQYRITPELVLLVKTSEDHQTTVVQLPEERDLI